MCIEVEIKLRPIIKEDLASLNRWKNDKETFKYLGGGFHPVSIDEQEKWLDSMIKMTNQNKRYIILADEKPIGMIGLYAIHLINQNCEVGVYIGEKEYRGKGYAKQAYLLFEDYAKQFLNIRKVKLFVVFENKHALSYWKKLGFEEVGTLHQERYIEGEFKDLMIMEKFLCK